MYPRQEETLTQTEWTFICSASRASSARGWPCKKTHTKAKSSSKLVQHKVGKISTQGCVISKEAKRNLVTNLLPCADVTYYSIVSCIPGCVNVLADKKCKIHATSPDSFFLMSAWFQCQPLQHGPRMYSFIWRLLLRWVLRSGVRASERERELQIRGNISHHAPRDPSSMHSRRSLSFPLLFYLVFDDTWCIPLKQSLETQFSNLESSGNPAMYFIETTSPNPTSSHFLEIKLHFFAGLLQTFLLWLFFSYPP